jgi:hypothetical protein
MSTAKYALPTHNLNGTAAQDVVDRTLKAFQTLGVLMEDFRECAPHGRDFIGPNDSLEQAQLEFRAHLAALEELKLYLAEHNFHAWEYLNKRG